MISQFPDQYKFLENLSSPLVFCVSTSFDHLGSPNLVFVSHLHEFLSFLIICKIQEQECGFYGIYVAVQAPPPQKQNAHGPCVVVTLTTCKHLMKVLNTCF